MFLRLSRLTGLPALGLALILSACAYEASSPDIDQRRVGALDPNSFNHFLREGYIELSDWEWEQQDYPDAHHFGDKARLIRPNFAPEMDMIQSRNLPTETLNEFALARNYISSAFARGAREAHPYEAARTQYLFDCWLEQQEENFQPDHIEFCKRQFDEAYALLQQHYPMQGGAPAIAGTRMPKPFIIFFDFDQAFLTAEAKAILDQVIYEANYFRPAQMIVTGHADRSGSNRYNDTLSAERAKAVTGYLLKRGIPREMLDSYYFGENKPLKPTRDGVKLRDNRYASIRFVGTNQ